MMLEAERSRKFAFVGTSSIGKTTLIKDLRAYYDGDKTVGLVPEAARIFFTHNKTPDRFSAATQGRVQLLALISERLVHARRPSLILCDRSVIDAVVYTQAKGDPDGAKMLLERVEEWLPSYDNFLLPSPDDVPYEKDTIRQEEEYERQKFHEGFLDFFQKTNLPHQIINGRRGQRVRKVLKIINNT